MIGFIHSSLFRCLVVSFVQACRIDLSGDACFDKRTACFVCVLFRLGSEWWLKKVAEGMNGSLAVDCVPGITEYLRDNDPIGSKKAELEWQRNAEQQFARREANGTAGQESNGTAAAAAAAVEGGGNGGGVGSFGVGVAVGAGGAAAVAEGAGEIGFIGGEAVWKKVRDSADTPDYFIHVATGETRMQLPPGTPFLDSLGGLASVPLAPPALTASQVGQSAHAAAASASSSSAAAAAAAASSSVPVPAVDPAAVSAAASELMGSLSAADMAVDVDSALGAVKALASVAERIPCVGLIMAPMKDIIGAVREARYNRLATKNLADRVAELATTLVSYFS